MFAWTAVNQKLLFPGLGRLRWTVRFMMRIAMMLGLAMSFLTNWWPIRHRIKQAM